MRQRYIRSFFGSRAGEIILTAIQDATEGRVRFQSTIRRVTSGVYDWEICVNGICSSILITEEEFQNVLNNTEHRLSQIGGAWINTYARVAEDGLLVWSGQVSW